MSISLETSFVGIFLWTSILGFFEVYYFYYVSIVTKLSSY